jgi:hypothetical protein
MKRNLTATALFAAFTLSACESAEPTSTPDAATETIDVEPDSVSCTTICELAASAACGPFGIVGSVFCGAAAVTTCETTCGQFKAGKMHCLSQSESSACMSDVKGDDGNTTNDYLSWCDHKVDNHRTYVQYLFRKGYTPPGTTQLPYPHINRTGEAPQGHCQTTELNPLLESPPAVAKWQVCTSDVGCSAWRTTVL